MKNQSISLVELGDFEPDRVNARRMFMYSTTALKAAEVVDKLCVNYPQFKAAFEAMDRAFQLAGVLSTPQGITITGDRGMGLSTAGSYFSKSLPQSATFDRPYAALTVHLAKNPTAGSIIEPLLAAVDHPFPMTTASRMQQKRRVLEDALRQRRTKMLIVDNAEYLLSQRALSRTDRAGTNCTAVLRYLMDEVPLSVVLLGDISREDIRRIDEAFADRLNVTVRLDRFAIGPSWSAFIRAFVKQCRSIDLSALVSDDEIRRLHDITAGSLRAFKHLVLEAVLVAHDAPAQSVSIDHLRLAFDRAFRGLRESNPYGC